LPPKIEVGQLLGKLGKALSREPKDLTAENKPQGQFGETIKKPDYPAYLRREITRHLKDGNRNRVVGELLRVPPPEIPEEYGEAWVESQRAVQFSDLAPKIKPVTMAGR
jgi:hypothetical protein